jgi:lysophospholipase L1-like esterase
MELMKMRYKTLFLMVFLFACTFPSAVAEEPFVDSQENPATPQLISPPVVPASPLPEAFFSGALHLIAIGDSLTQGDGDDLGLGYPGRLLELMNQTNPNSTMVNLGQSGWNSDALIAGDQGLIGQLPRAIEEVQNATAQGRGSIVLIWIGSNDLWYLYEFGGDIGAEQEAEDLAHFSNNISLILAELKNNGAMVVIALLDDQSKRPVAVKGEAFTAITQNELTQMGIHVQKYNETITQQAQQYGAYTVDFYSTDIFTNPATLYDDGNHPNSNGYDLIANQWYQVLINNLP